VHAPRPVLATAAAAAALLLAAGPASAHVSIPEPVTAGGISELSLTVPNERDDAATVVVEVKLPEDHPLAMVSARAKPGWQSEVTTRALDEPVELFSREVTEVVDTVRWSGGTIAPGQYDTFTLRAGPFPEDVAELVVPAIQTYDSGEEVAWVEVAGAGADEPEHPAPVLTVVAAAGGTTDEHGAASDPGDEGATAEEGPEEAPGEEAAAGDGSAGDPAPDVDGQALGATGDEDDGVEPLSIVALVVAVVAAGLGGAALAASRRRG
jgi:uncharacterized protein YcnI